MITDEHYCVCGRPSYRHSEDCYEGVNFEEDPRGATHHIHVPPLCCPDCPCLSFAEAHPDSDLTPDWARQLVREDQARRDRAETEKKIQRAKWRAAYWRKKTRQIQREASR